MAAPCTPYRWRAPHHPSAGRTTPAGRRTTPATFPGPETTGRRVADPRLPPGGSWPSVPALDVGAQVRRDVLGPPLQAYVGQQAAQAVRGCREFLDVYLPAGGHDRLALLAPSG